MGERGGLGGWVGRSRGKANGEEGRRRGTANGEEGGRREEGGMLRKRCGSGR